MESNNHEPSTRSKSSPSTCHSSNGYNIHKPSPSTLSTSHTISSPPLLSSSKIAMLSRASLALSLRSPAPEPFPFGGDGAMVALPSLSSVLRLSKKGPRGGALVAMATDSRTLSGIVFEPFEGLKREGSHLVPLSPHESLARQCYSHDCETAINVQINVEYNVSYVYHALYAYFDRDNVALKGFAKFFKESSEEEREHAEKLMKYQNKRGGRVKLHSIVRPPSEFDHPEKGEALHAMELALSLEKLTNEKLLHLHGVACKCNDPQMADFVESEFLGEQVEAIKKISDYISQLRRVGKGHGVWHFDQMLLHEEEAVVA